MARAFVGSFDGEVDDGRGMMDHFNYDCFNGGCAVLHLCR